MLCTSACIRYVLLQSHQSDILLFSARRERHRLKFSAARRTKRILKHRTPYSWANPIQIFLTVLEPVYRGIRANMLMATSHLRSRLFVCLSLLSSTYAVEDSPYIIFPKSNISPQNSFRLANYITSQAATPNNVYSSMLPGQKIPEFWVAEMSEPKWGELVFSEYRGLANARGFKKWIVLIVEARLNVYISTI